VKFQATAFARQNAFTGYGEGYVMINGERHERSLIVLADRILPWSLPGFEALAPAHFAELLAMKPEVVLLGTGARLRFPPPPVLAALPAAGIGFEVMDTRAACRTYNILVAEERVVAAALVLD